MPTVTVYPDASGYIQQWTWVGGGTYADLADDSDVGGYIRSNTNNLLSFWSMKPITDYVPLSAIACINDIIAYWRIRDNTGGGGSSNYWGIRLSGSNVFTASWYQSIAAWAWKTEPGISRPGGGNWSKNDLTTSIETGVKAKVSGGQTQCTELRYKADYAPVSGGFSFLVANWLPPILAVASHGLLKREIDTILQTGHDWGINPYPSSKEDYSKLFDAIARRPAYGF